ncbi:hypothetical protein BJ742DRAFT_779542 [Cladochytrium replicatum]|nr:hypothetical protein BJ742DRAFT_779542 [Cladochytrium replicatum]
MAQTSEDIIKHIIRDIVARSSVVLKSQQRNADAPLCAAELVQPPSGSPTNRGGGVNNLASSRKHKTTIITETLAAFMVRAIVLDPRNEFRVERELTRDEVERLIRLAVEKLTSVDNPVIETIKMQVYFDSNFPAQGDFLHREKISRINGCSQTLKEVTETQAKTVPDYEALYRKIISYILLRSHVGSPTDIRIVRETTAALESVFPQAELSSFTHLPRNEKESQLNGLAQLVTGIRLFNRQLGKGGEGIENPVVDYVDKAQSPDLGAGPGILHPDPTNPSLPSLVSLSRVKSALIFRRQLLIYLDALQEQGEKSRKTLSQLTERFDEAIRDLKATCRSKTAVPVDQVYPLFILLATLWSNWLDELFLLAFRRGVLETIVAHSKAFTIDIPQTTKTGATPYMLDIEPENKDEPEIISKASELMAAISVINKAVEVKHPGNTTQYFSLPVEYGGFCPYSLIRRDGLVKPGNKSLGLLRYRDRLFAFASFDAAKEFSKFPDRYIEGVLETAKRSPDLVQLFHLYNYFPTVDALERAKSFTKQKMLGRLPLVSEAGTQVDTHIVDTFVDPNYEWNEWQLRRRGLMLVNLKNKKTHSVQTDMSHFRRDSETQHYEPKTSDTQTYTTSGSMVPKRTNYLAGLRQDGQRQFRVVDLTFDL